jgi:hypothetical protein
MASVVPLQPPILCGLQRTHRDLVAHTSGVHSEGLATLGYCMIWNLGVPSPDLLEWQQTSDSEPGCWRLIILQCHYGALAVCTGLCRALLEKQEEVDPAPASMGQIRSAGAAQRAASLPRHRQSGAWAGHCQPSVPLSCNIRAWHPGLPLPEALPAWCLCSVDCQGGQPSMALGGSLGG